MCRLRCGAVLPASFQPRMLRILFCRGLLGSGWVKMGIFAFRIFCEGWGVGVV